MSRFSIAGRATIAGTAVRPLASVYATAGVRPVIREIGITNTTAVALAAAIARLTAAGTQGAALTEQKEDDTAQTALATGFAGHTADLTAAQSSDNIVRQASIGAAIGSGMVWVFGGQGLIVPEGTGNGVGIIVPTGTGQVLDYWIVWDE